MSRGRIDDSAPEAHYTRTLHGSGRLICGELAIEVSGFTLERGEYAHEAKWALLGLAEGAGRQLSDVVFGRAGPVHFEGSTAYGVPVRAEGIRARRLQGSHFTATAREVFLGPSLLDFDPESQTVRVFLTVTDLALEEVEILSNWWTGERKSEGQKVPLPAWSSSLGSLTFSVQYAWEKVRVGDMEGEVAIPRPGFFGVVATPTRDVAWIKATLVEELRPLMRLLSFLSRHQVDWCALEIDSFSEAREHTQNHVWRSTWFRPPSNRLDPLVHPALLPTSYIDDMLGALNKLQYRDAALLTIGFLIGALDSKYLENSVMSAFTALETLVSAISQHDGTAYLLSQSDFKKLRKDLLQEIERHPVVAKLSPELRMGLCAKLPELRRAPITGLIVDLLVRSATKWEDMWPQGAELESEIRAAYSRRSSLVHEGRIEDANKSDADRWRMHILTERVLYGILGGKPEWHGPLAYRHMSWLGEH